MSFPPPLKLGVVAVQADMQCTQIIGKEVIYVQLLVAEAVHMPALYWMLPQAKR